MENQIEPWDWNYEVDGLFIPTKIENIDEKLKSLDKLLQEKGLK